tara:strand:+ start:68 stop:187 length:120 start_codon:yes stop_codon:yes gene_type:complete
MFNAFLIQYAREQLGFIPNRFSNEFLEMARHAYEQTKEV